MMGKYGNNTYKESRNDLLQKITNELAETNRLKRLEIQYMLANHGIDTDMIKNNEELEDKA